MNKYFLSLLVGFVLVAAPVAASAHEHASYEIGGTTYNIVIGSLNEPIAVDDKTGLELTVTKGGGMPTMSDDGDMDGPAADAAPVTGLEDTLKVEMIAGDQKKTYDLSPAWGNPGAYETVFYPTIATTFSYHLMGTIEGKAVDLTFTCVPEGTPEAEDDMTEKMLSGGITQISHGGAFTCPVAKEELGFPEKSASVNSMKSTGTTAMAALGLSVLALVVGFVGSRRKKA